MVSVWVIKLKVTITLKDGLTGSEYARKIVSLVGGRVVFASKISPVLVIEVDEDKVDDFRSDVAKLSQVKRVEEEKPKVRLLGEVASGDVIFTLGDVEKYVRLDYVKNRGFRGSGISIGIVDSGIDVSHPAFYLKDMICQDFTNTGEEDRVGHGTWVASAAGGKGFNTKDYGYLEGMSPDSRLLIAKCFDGVETDVDVAIRGIEWCVLNGAKIVNCSWGGTEPYEPLRLVCDAALRRGVIIVAAAGNYGPKSGSITYPAGYKETIAVGSVSMQDGRVAYWSSRGPSIDGVKPDVVAPGGADDDELILSAIPDGVGAFQGTSMAAPMVSGGLANLYQARSYAADALLQAGYESKGYKDNDYGYGITDFRKAMIADVGEKVLSKITVFGLLLQILGIALSLRAMKMGEMVI